MHYGPEMLKLRLTHTEYIVDHYMKHNTEYIMSVALYKGSYYNIKHHTGTILASQKMLKASSNTSHRI